MALTHEDEELPPDRAAALAKREAEFRKLVNPPLIEKFKKKPS